MTHERTHQVLLFAAKLTFAIVILYALVGCGGPTSPAPLNTQQEQQEAFIQCFASLLGWGPMDVTFTDKHEKVTIDGEEYDKAGWAYVFTNKIVIWNGWLLGTANGYAPAEPWAMRDIAAHEVCHAIGGWADHGSQWRGCYEGLLARQECR